MATAFTTFTLIFVAYWVGTLVIFTIGRFAALGLWFLGFMRLWIKPLFWMNFLYFAVVEAIFSAIYWLSYGLMNLTGFMRPMNALFRAVQPSAGNNPAVETWLFISILIFAVIMIPYMFIHVRVSHYFKRSLLNLLAPEFALDKARLVSQAPDRLLPTSFVRAVVASDADERAWIEACFDPDVDQKFELSTTNADHFSCETGGKPVDFWESQVMIKRLSPVTDSDGKKRYEGDHRTVFDGIVLRLEGVMPSNWTAEMFVVEPDAKSVADHRERHKQGFFIWIVEMLNQGGANHGSAASSKPGDYPESLPNLNPANSGKIRFAGVESDNLYLFVETGLEGTAFDMNQNIGIRRNMELFRKDLEMVRQHLDLAPGIIDAAEAWLAGSYRQSA